jgi:DNA-binding PadR family transcriptional regulator
MRHVARRSIGSPADSALPLSEPVFFILLGLADKPRHGYALIKEVEALSDGRVRLRTGTLYGAFRRLLEEGFIERHDQADTARDKQAYRLTATGRARVRREAERLKENAAAAAARLRVRKA